MSSEAELLEAWRAGDASAADTLLRSHFDGVYRFFRAKLSGDVEDLVQRTFLGCLEGKGKITEGGVRAYLYGVARNVLMDHLRQHYRRGERLDPMTQSIRDLGTTPSRAVVRRDGHEALLAAMQTLPVDTQILLELAYWEELSGREIAAVLRIEENTVRSRLARARVALRGALEADLGSRAAQGLLTTLGKTET